MPERSTSITTRSRSTARAEPYFVYIKYFYRIDKIGWTDYYQNIMKQLSKDKIARRDIDKIKYDVSWTRIRFLLVHYFKHVHIKLNVVVTFSFYQWTMEEKTILG